MKYKLAEKKFFPELNRELWQIEAIADFGDVKKGDRGGWIEKEENLSQDGNAWVFGNAWVCDNAWVSGAAQVYGNTQVSGYACVHDAAEILVLGKLGDNNRDITCTPDKNRKMQISCGCFLGGIDAFEEAVRKKYGDNPNSDYMLILPLLRKKELEWRSNER